MKPTTTMETITMNDVPALYGYHKAITITTGNDIYLTKDLANELMLPDKRMLFHFDKGKMLVSATTSTSGFEAAVRNGMVRLPRGRSLAKHLISKGLVEPGTRITFIDEPINGHFVEHDRAPSRGYKKTPTKN